jgi:radical SAM superfamily enzyme YgiQ (UPF0313 family)
MTKKLKFVLINPPIYDFSAFDSWVKPLGLLYISNILKSLGYETVFLDCMDRNLQKINKTKDDGTGKFDYEIVPKPEILKDVPLHYKRYGINHELIKKFLLFHKDADFVLITSIMTYWYLGVKEIVDITKSLLPKTKVVLGGILPILIPNFCKNFFGDKVDYFYTYSTIGNFLDTVIGVNPEHKKFDEFKNFPEPDYSFYKQTNYVVLRTSYGCFYNCDYCACANIIPKYYTKDISQIISEIKSIYQKTKTQNFVFYDDALLDKNLSKTKSLFYELTKLNLNLKFYTPNGINPKFIDSEIAKLMFDLNFTDPRLSLETANDNIHNIVDKKIKLKEFEFGLNNLIKVGYQPHKISVYILAGLPQEKLDDVYHSIDTVSKYGLKIRLCELSPVPKSKLFFSYGLDETIDPLLHNNTIFLYYGIPQKVKPWCSYNEMQKLKLYVQNLNTKNKEKLCSTHTHICLTKN